MKEALKWLQAHNGDGLHERRYGTIYAGGERAPHERRTWTGLANEGLVEFYEVNGKSKARIRLTSLGKVAAQ